MQCHTRCTQPVSCNKVAPCMSGFSAHVQIIMGAELKYVTPTLDVKLAK